MAGLRYRLEVPPQLPGTPISPELRHNVFLAAKESITNVVRHAQATAVSLRLRLEAGRLHPGDRGQRAGLGGPGSEGGADQKWVAQHAQTDGGYRRQLLRWARPRKRGTVVRLTAPLANGGS